MLINLLCFDPEKRLAVEEALSHPYLEALHCPDDEPSSPPVAKAAFEFERHLLSTEELRELIVNEASVARGEQRAPPLNPIFSCRRRTGVPARPSRSIDAHLLLPTPAQVRYYHGDGAGSRKSRGSSECAFDEAAADLREALPGEGKTKK